MGIRFISAVAENRHFTPSEKLVLMCLGDHADEAGLSWPSVARIGDWTGLDRKTVFIILKRMEDIGCLTREKRHGVVNKYRLSIEAIQAYTSTKSGTTPAMNKPIDAQGSAEIGTSQTSAEIGTSTKSGTTTSTKNGTTLVPKTGHGTVNEPSLEPSIYIAYVAAFKHLESIEKFEVDIKVMHEVIAYFQRKGIAVEQVEAAAISMQGKIWYERGLWKYKTLNGTQASKNLYGILKAWAARKPYEGSSNGRTSTGPRTNAGADLSEYERSAAIYNVGHQVSSDVS